MKVFLLKSKIHCAVVTSADLNYEGSLTISADLAELVGLQEYKRILVGNLSNGERFETYAIYRIQNQGVIQSDGARAHLGKPGDRLTIISFGAYHPEEATSHQSEETARFWAISDQRNRWSV